MKSQALIIEDDADTARLLGIFMERNGWNYEHTDSLEAGIRRANTHPFPEVILLDLNLLDSVATDTVARLPELMRNGPVVVLSNYEDDALKDRITAAGAYFCRKEVDAVGAKRIFEAMIQAIRAWRNAGVVSPKKQTSRIDTNLLEMHAIQSTLNPANGHA